MVEPQAKPIIRLSDKSEKITVRCSEELKKAVAHAAIDRGLRVEALCVQLIAAGLGLTVESGKAGMAA